MTKKHELTALPFVLLKGIAVLGIAFLLAFALNSAMQKFLDAEIASINEINARAEARQQKIEEALRAAENETAAAVLEAQMAIERAEQFEAFYQRYKHSSSIINYGKFYELFYQTYRADTIILGTSHTSYGVNPQFLCDAMPDRSFFNFATDGTNPAYYLEWWKVFLESGYPMPDTVIYCVDWFMCDEKWLWRRITTDSNPSGALSVIRKIKEREDMRAEETPAAETTAAPAETADPTESAASPVQPQAAPAEEKINLFDLDALADYLFNRIPIIYARDRIPEMISFYLNGAVFPQPEEPDIEAELARIARMAENAEIPEIPVYEHEYLIQGNAVVSAYCRGHVPIDKKGYTGTPVSRSYIDFAHQWTAFRELLDIFTQNGIRVIFVEVPEYIPGRYIGGDKNSTVMQDNNARIRAIADEYGIPFFNYNEELASDINQNYTYFYDWGHMNVSGSLAYSPILARDLAEYFAASEE